MSDRTPKATPSKKGPIIFGLVLIVSAILWLRSTPDMTPAEQNAIFVHYLVSDSPHVLVWRDADAFSEGVKLYAAGVAPTKLTRLLACAPDSGTKAIVVSGSMFSSIVQVAVGPNEGCRGFIDNSFLKNHAP